MDHGEVDSVLQEGKGVNLINLPHISPDMLTLQALLEMKIESEGSSPVHFEDDKMIYNDNGKMINLTKGFEASWEWFENKFKVVNKGDAIPCFQIVPPHRSILLIPPLLVLETPVPGGVCI
ncbi:hypothetical protein L486_08472 [Kwoniella mangroviensis CBS 10435]|uniref:Uncharacterized protein n=1 Tax=Kwoniella mangroviensis CBS 10435 TaxID=1331196 RepID=A0A1B9IEP0_9TREE|nr:hypothetical protein L486_08472 [Kwoniella mangroviensis CBS 10435]